MISENKLNLSMISIMYREAEKTFAQIQREFNLFNKDYDPKRKARLEDLCFDWSWKAWFITDLHKRMAGQEVPDLYRQELLRLRTMDWKVTDTKKALRSPFVDADKVNKELANTAKLKKKYLFFDLFGENLMSRVDTYLASVKAFLDKTQDVIEMSELERAHALRLSHSLMGLYQVSSKDFRDQVKLQRHSKEVLQALSDRHHAILTFTNLSAPTEKAMPAPAHQDPHMREHVYETLSGVCRIRIETQSNGENIIHLQGHPGLEGAALDRALKQVIKQTSATPEVTPQPRSQKIDLFYAFEMQERSRLENDEPYEFELAKHQAILMQAAPSTQASTVTSMPLAQPSFIARLGQRIAQFGRRVMRAIFPNEDRAFLAQSHPQSNINPNTVPQASVTREVIEDAHERHQLKSSITQTVTEDDEAQKGSDKGPHQHGPRH